MTSRRRPTTRQLEVRRVRAIYIIIILYAYRERDSVELLKII